MSEEALRRATEHAGYLATAADHFMMVVSDVAGVAEEHLDDRLRDRYSEAWKGLRECIYEFRKRRDRAALSEGQAPEPDPHELIWCEEHACHHTPATERFIHGAQQAPEPVAQEPVAWAYTSAISGGPILSSVRWPAEDRESWRETPLYTHSAGMDAARAKVIEADAARYRWLRSDRACFPFSWHMPVRLAEMDEIIDKQMAREVRALATKGAEKEKNDAGND